MAFTDSECAGIRAACDRLERALRNCERAAAGQPPVTTYADFWDEITRVSPNMFRQ